MFRFSSRTALPAAVLLGATAFLLGAAPQALLPAPTAARVTPPSVVAAEVGLCEARSGRSRAECIEETEGKELIRRAEWLAQAQARDDLTGAQATVSDVAGSTRTSAQ